MQKLVNYSKELHDILYYIWQLLVNYSNLFGFDTPEAAHQLNAKIFRDNTLTKIRVSVPRIKELNSPYSMEEMRNMLNEYLGLLLQYSDLPPFAAGKNYNEIVEPLFITILVENDWWFDMDFLWVDNMDAYRKVKENNTQNIINIV